MQKPISTDPAVFGTLHDCTDLLGNPEALRQHIENEGYIYLKGVLDTSKIAAARQRQHPTDGGLVRWRHD